MLRHERPPDKDNSPSLLNRLLRRVDGCEIKMVFDGKADEERVAIDDMQSRTRERFPLYGWKEAVKGCAVLTPTGSSYSHSGVLIELIGTVSVFTDQEIKKVFLHQQRRFEADTVSRPTPFDFEFAGPKEYESYRGISAAVSYKVKVTVSRPVKSVSQKEEIWVTRVDEETSDANAASGQKRSSYFREESFGPQSVAMEVGVDNLVHIEFRYNKKLFHLNEQVLGKVTFKAADMDIQYGEVGLVKKEYIGIDSTSFESETLQKFEVMEGTPIVGEVVPIRLYLNSVPRLTPTYANVYNCFKVLYYLNLVLVTGENKRYFKQQEVTLYRARGQDLPVNMEPLKEV